MENSNKLAISSLEKIIQECDNDINAIEKLIEGNENISAMLYYQLNKKIALKASLEELIDQIKSMTGSFTKLKKDEDTTDKISHLDRKYDKILEKIDQKQEALGSDCETKNFWVSMHRDSLSQKIENLKQKKVSMEEKQQKIVDKKVKRIVRRKSFETKEEVIDSTKEDIKSKYQMQREYYESKVEDKHKIVQKLYLVPKFISHAKEKSLLAYLSILKGKNKIAQGASKLPGFVVDKIKEQISARRKHK